MGYQEAYEPIGHLAEAAGIKKAIEEYGGVKEDSGGCWYCCAVRPRTEEDGMEYLESAGPYYACIAGARHIVFKIASHAIPEWDVGLDWNYPEHFEDLDESLVVAAALERPDLVEEAYKITVGRLEAIRRANRRWHEDLREEANSLKPVIEGFLKSYGPARMSEFEHCEALKGHSMFNVVVDLLNQDYLAYEGEFKDALFWFADQSIAGTYEDALERVPKSLDGRIIRFLGAMGPADARMIARRMGASEQHVRSMLKRLLRDGGLAVGKRGRANWYRLAETP